VKIMNSWDEFLQPNSFDNKDAKGREYAQTLVELLHCVSTRRSLEKSSLDIPVLSFCQKTKFASDF